MRNVVFSYAVLCGLTGSASAAEQGLASYFQYSRFAGLVAAHRSLPMGSQVRVVIMKLAALRNDRIDAPCRLTDLSTASVSAPMSINSSCLR